MYMESYSKSSANAVTRIRHTPLLLTLGAHFGIDCIPAKSSLLKLSRPEFSRIRKYF